jgi:hypothetical protein
MSEEEKFAKIERCLEGIQQVSGAETMLMSALIVVLNQEIPNFKSRMLDLILRVKNGDRRSNAMVLEASKFIEALEEVLQT